MRDKMRNIIVLLLSIFLIGSAMAVQNFGPPSGIKVQALEVAGATTLAGITATGTVQGEHIVSTDDAAINDRITFADFYASDDGYVLDDFYVGSVTALNATTATTGYFSGTLGAAGQFGKPYSPRFRVGRIRAASDCRRLFGTRP